MRAPPFAALLAVALLSGCGGASRSATTTTATAVRPAGPDAEQAATLGPTNAPTSAPHRRLPPLRACAKPDEADIEMDRPKVAGGASCAIAAKLAVRVTHWWAERCHLHCPAAYPMGDGYACDAFLVGEAAWTFDCRNGRRLVHLSLAD